MEIFKTNNRYDTTPSFFDERPRDFRPKPFGTVAEHPASMPKPLVGQR
ncbi:MAG: hypothetical protein LBU42_05700 [Prevotellaceae bacterium]|nr:hypothetical protein [Prevotellaceae bacterium]